MFRVSGGSEGETIKAGRECEATDEGSRESVPSVPGGDAHVNRGPDPRAAPENHFLTTPRGAPKLRTVSGKPCFPETPQFFN